MPSSGRGPLSRCHDRGAPRGGGGGGGGGSSGGGSNDGGDSNGGGNGGGKGGGNGGGNGGNGGNGGDNGGNGTGGDSGIGGGGGGGGGGGNGGGSSCDNGGGNDGCGGGESGPSPQPGTAGRSRSPQLTGHASLPGSALGMPPVKQSGSFLAGRRGRSCGGRRRGIRRHHISSRASIQVAESLTERITAFRRTPRRHEGIPPMFRDGDVAVGVAHAFVVAHGPECTPGHIHVKKDGLEATQVFTAARDQQSTED